MTNNELLQKQGYVVIPQVLSPEEVQKARSILTRLFDEKSNLPGNLNRTSEEGGSVYVDIFSRHEDLRWILFHPKLIEGLASALGKDFIILPDAAMHDSQYGGWHKDSTSQERNGHKFQYEDNFQLVTTALYLQDNSAEYGGGLDIIPDSHKETKDRFAVKLTLFDRIKNKIFNTKPPNEANFPNKKTIPNKAGDVVIFNHRLTHKATHPAVKPVPEEHRKFAIFIICSANNKHARTFTNYIKNRPDYTYLKDHKYPEELLTEAKKYQLSLMEV